MGFVLKYCVTCGARIPEEDFESGVAVEWQQKTYCREHVPAEAAAAVQKRKNTSPAVARIRRQSGRTAAMTPSGRQVGTRRESGRTSGSRPVSAVSSGVRDGGGDRQKSSMVPVVVVSVAVLAIVAALGVILASGGSGAGAGQRGDSPTADTGNSPDPERRSGNRLQDLNERTRAEMTRWRQFDDAPPDDRLAVASEGFDRTRKLVADTEDYARRVDDNPAQRLPADRMRVLSSLLDNWCRAATEPKVRDIRELADRTARDRSVQDALQLVGDVLQGRNRDYLDRRFLIRLPDGADSWPGRELRQLAADLRERGGAADDSFTAAERAAMQALDDIERDTRGWQDATRTDESWWQDGLRWLRRVVDLPDEHPAVENQRPPDGDPGARHRALTRSLADRLFTFLDRQWRSLERDDAASVTAFTRRAQEFSEQAPDWLPMHSTLQMWLRDLARQDTDPGSGGTEGLAARLDQAERDARGALESTDHTELLRVFARLQRAMALVEMRESKQQQRVRLLVRLHERMWQQLNATVGDVGGTPRQARWRAAAFFLFQMSVATTATREFQPRIQQLSGRFGPHPVSEYVAMLSFLEEARNGDEPGGDTSDALWTYYQALAAMTMRVYQQSREESLARVVNTAASFCVQVAMSRDPTSLRAAQEAQRLQAQLDFCRRNFVSAERQPDLARAIEQRIQRCAQLVGTLPTARE